MTDGTFDNMVGNSDNRSINLSPRPLSRTPASHNAPFHDFAELIKQRTQINRNPRSRTNSGCW